MHLRVGAGRLVALAAEVQHAVYDDPAHFLERRAAVLPGIVGYGLDVDENVARNDAFAFAVAVIERNDVGEIVVPEPLTVHLQEPLRRAKNVAHIAQRIPFRFGHFAQPCRRQAFLRQPEGTIVVIVSYCHV